MLDELAEQLELPPRQGERPTGHPRLERRRVHDEIADDERVAGGGGPGHRARRGRNRARREPQPQVDLGGPGVGEQQAVDHRFGVGGQFGVGTEDQEPGQSGPRPGRRGRELARRPGPVTAVEQDRVDPVEGGEHPGRGDGRERRRVAREQRETGDDVVDGARRGDEEQVHANLPSHRVGTASAHPVRR